MVNSNNNGRLQRGQGRAVGAAGRDGGTGVAPKRGSPPLEASVLLETHDISGSWGLFVISAEFI